MFKYDGGLAEFVKYINRTEEPLHPPIHIEKTVDQVAVEIAMQYTRGEEERNRCYTNNAFNSIGGTHLSGFRTALTRTLNAYGAKEELFKNVTPIGEDFREGLTVVISVQVPEPQFDSQEKKRLNNLEVEGIVAGVVSEHLAQVPGGEPEGRADDHEEGGAGGRGPRGGEQGQEGAEGPQKHPERRRPAGQAVRLHQPRPRRARNCSWWRAIRPAARPRAAATATYQAILPLRGKPLNVEKARLENLLNNAEITSLISAVGVDIGNTRRREQIATTVRSSS